MSIIPSSNAAPPEIIKANAAPPSFALYDLAGFGRHLLPILPPDAIINPQNVNRGKLEEKRGKVPGYKGRNGWSGMADWPNLSATPADHRRWDSWDCGIGLLGRNFPAIDIDIMDDEVASDIQNAALELLGPAPIRFGRGARRLLVYSGEGFSKAAHTVRDPDSTLDEDQAVELLAEGQQYVIEGIHPKTNSLYRWVDDRRPATVGADNLTILTPENLARFWSRVATVFNVNQWDTISKASANTQGGRRQVDQTKLLAPSPAAIREALFSIENVVDYSAWINLGRATKAAAGPEEEAAAFEIWSEWSDAYPENTPENTETVWHSLRPPHEIGWHMLADMAVRLGDGSFSAATYDFEAVTEAPTPAPTTSMKPELEALFERFVYVKGLGRVFDLNTGELIGQEDFNVDNRHLGHPRSRSKCAYAQFVSEKNALKVAAGLTYRPGGPLFVNENLEGLAGRRLNFWRPPTNSLPAAVTTPDVQFWLDHIAFIVPDENDREHVINWMSWIVQNPAEKPNWGLVLGSKFQGVGKDAMIQPLSAALGAENVRNTTPQQLESGWTHYLKGVRLLIVQEMHRSNRTGFMDQMKPLMAAPPNTLTINIKNMPHYEVPNLVAVVLMTNHYNAVATSETDRRYCVIFNEEAPKEKSYYDELWRWYENGGGEKAARWLLSRDLKGWDAKGNAPDTKAKRQMSLATRSDLQAFLQDGIEYGAGPLCRKYVSLPEVAAFVAEGLGDKRLGTTNRVAPALKELGVFRFDQRVELGGCRADHHSPMGGEPRWRFVYQLRDVDQPADLEPALIRNLYWQERRCSQTANEIFGLDQT